MSKKIKLQFEDNQPHLFSIIQNVMSQLECLLPQTDDYVMDSYEASSCMGSYTAH